MHCEEIDYQIYGNDMQVVELELDPGETVIAEAGATNWMDDGITFEARMGEGLFLATLQGTCVVYLQSLPFSRLADRILENAPSAGGKQRGEGSVLGSLGNLVGGR